MGNKAVNTAPPGLLTPFLPWLPAMLECDPRVVRGNKPLSLQGHDVLFTGIEILRQYENRV